MSEADKLGPIRNHPLLRGLAPAVIEELGSCMTRRVVQRGATIFVKGDPGTALMAIRAGAVKISAASADGREALLNIIEAGDIFGEIALLDGSPRTADAIAMSDCLLLVMERRDFMTLIRNRPEIAFRFIELLCARLRRTSEQVEDVMYLNLAGRLAKALLRLSADSGSPAPARRVTLTHRAIGQMIGISRESTNKQLHEWARRKWVRLERGAIVVLDPDTLARIGEGGFDGDLG